MEALQINTMSKITYQRVGWWRRHCHESWTQIPQHVLPSHWQWVRHSGPRTRLCSLWKLSVAAAPPLRVESVKSLLLPVTSIQLQASSGYRSLAASGSCPYWVNSRVWENNHDVFTFSSRNQLFIIWWVEGAFTNTKFIAASITSSKLYWTPILRRGDL